MGANSAENPSRRWARSITVQGWQNIVLSVMGAVVLAGAVAGGLLLARTDHISRELVDAIEPARVAAYRLQSALRDQEAAVRGYVITADRAFLTRYYEGQRNEQAATHDIRDHMAHRHKMVDDLEAIENVAATWRSTYAEPLIASVSHGGTNAAATNNAQGNADFDRLRGLFDAQNRRLLSARNAAVDDLTRVRRWRDTVLAAMLAAFFAMTVLAALLVRSAVTRPLAALAASCRRITAGNFGERIIPTGPQDIRAIARDVEEMRQRIVEELDASRSAHETLDEQAIELRRSNAELEQFAYVASHDLQEPLRKVTSFCQLIEKRYGDKLDERGVEYIGFAVDGAKRMQVLINDLLIFSRVGRLNATHTEVNLNDALDAALANLATAIDESDAQIVRPGHPLPAVEGDPTLLVMVWQNLIGNAVKFRQENVAPRVIIDCEPGDENWILSVTDNGIGIAEEFTDKVFIIFQRLHGRDTYSGTGIGLALCKKIVEHHGGTIWIDTSYTEGTRFRFTLPAVPVDAPEQTSAALLEGAHE
jgi:signal transduction histidine kinase